LSYSRQVWNRNSVGWAICALHNGVSQGSLEYEGAKALYLDEVKYAAKKRRQIIEKRVEMYCKMYNAIGTTARAESRIQIHSRYGR
jgi:hypothetical protein